MPSPRKAHRLPLSNGADPSVTDPSLEELSNKTRNELQKTVLLLEHGNILRQEYEMLLEGCQELLESGKKSMPEPKVALKKANRSANGRNGRRSSKL